MVKFSKQFEDQLIPEWKYAFLDYSQLKKYLKNIHLSETETETEACLVKTITSPLLNLSFFGIQRREHRGAIEVHKKVTSSGSKGFVYETELLENFADMDAVKEFFVCMDEQLNKVNQFYKTKEKELMERGECLKIQLKVLMTIKDILKQQRSKAASSNESNEEESILCTLSCENCVKIRREEEEEQLQEDLETNVTEEEQIDESVKMKSGQVFSCQGKNFKIKIPITKPSMAFSAICYLIKEDLVKQSSTKCDINKKNLHHGEKMIKKALIELHKGLNYLKTYRNLNNLAFMKILKKFDKVTGKQILPIYLRVVESSYFNSSDKVINLSDKVEELFINHFAHEDRIKAMKYLKPHQRKDSHSITFFIGLFTGCFLALLVGYIIMANLFGIYRLHSDDTLYMETAYPVLSMFGLLFLHIFLYGCNIFMWRKTRVNYSFIFELGPAKELKYRDVFLICSVSMTVVFGVMFIHLLLLSKGYFYSQVQVIPGLLLLIFLILLVCPLNIFYKSSRFRFISVIRNIVLSPLYKVSMLDFFMADQLCSQIPMLRNLEYIACYYITGSYRKQDYGYCMRVIYFKDLAYAVSFLPYYWRAMQCARRWIDEGETSHLVNLGKYVSAMLAAGSKLAYENERSVGWLSLMVVMSSAATVYQLYWDFVKDWGLLQLNSKNPWLRNELMLRHNFFYYFSMVLNLILRLAWLQTVLHSNFMHVDHRLTTLFLAALEVIRRGLWNFFRLENEHLNNTGKFRAVKTVPLPFKEVDDED